ncbi:MAG: hypothetical protein WBD64_13725, partial [Candidatus Zixiibacteriota bacterium]
MLSKLTSPFVQIILLTCFLSVSSQAQLISSEIYETEEDLLEGLQLGYLTLDQYLELLDMIRSKLYPASDDADRLFFVPDVSSLDVLQVKAKNQGVDLSQKVGSFLAEEKKKSRLPFSGRLVWKLYQELAEEGDAENYLLCQVTNGRRMIWHIEADQQANSSQAALTSGDLRVRKRSLKFLLPEYSSEVVLGNFDKRIGLGLNVGYHPLIGYSTRSDFKPEDSFLYPALGRYNGIYGESKLKSFKMVAFYSRNKRQEIENRIGAFDLSFGNKELNAGLCFSEGELRNVENGTILADDCRSLHFDLKLKPATFSGEYALLPGKKSGLAIELYSSRKSYSFDLSWWRYDDQFVHPHGGGFSNPDYESVYLDEIDYTYRSRQAGERGVFFKSRYRIIERITLDFSYSRWKERSDLPDKMKLRLGSGYKFSRDFSFTVYQLWTDYRVDDEQIDRTTSSLNLFLSPHRKLDFNLIANYRNTLSKDYGDLRLKIRTRALSPFDFVLWLKYNDPNFSRRSDGYLSFHLQETLRFFESCFVSAEYIAKF